MLLSVATRGEGVDALISALERHHAYLDAGGRRAGWRRRRLAERTRAAVDRAMRHWVWSDTLAERMLTERLDAVVEGRRSPYEVAAEIVERVRSGTGDGRGGE